VDKPITIYGAPGFGSVPVEAAMTLIGLPYEVIDVGEDEINAGVRGLNPIRQVPTLVLPGGEVMTESAAMLIWLADRYPEAHLAPDPLSRKRPAFLRWMTFVAAGIYALSWARDDPERLVTAKTQHAVLRERVADRRIECWQAMNAQVHPGRYILGEDLSVLDLYVAVISRWSPRRKRFYAAAPKLADVVRRVDAEPRLADVWAKRFPFVEGWEG